MRCALHECLSKLRAHLQAIAPPTDVLVSHDSQVSEHSLIDGTVVRVSTEFPIISRCAVECVRSI